MGMDPNLLQRFQQGSLLGAALGGINQGQEMNNRNAQFRDADLKRKQERASMEAQQQAETRKRGFEQNVRGLLGSYGDYAYTQEGQKGLLGDLSKAGYGPEAMGLFGNMQQTFPGPAPVKPPTYQQAETDQGLTSFDPSTGAYGAPAMGPGGAPLMKQYKPEAERAGKFQLVKNRQGQMVSVDVESGLGKDGKSVDAWQDPIKPDAPNSTNVFSQEQQLRNQYMVQTKDFRTIRDSFSTIHASAKNPSPAGDLSLIFSYMKVLDPTSTVREGEFANAQNATGVPERVLNMYNKVKSGERLNPEQRADFVGRAKMLYSKAEFQKKKTQGEYKKLAGQYPGLNPDRITMDDDIAEDTGTVPPDPRKAMATHDQYDTLPSGSEFTDPAGNVRRKP